MAEYNIEVIVDPRKAVKGANQSIKSLGQVEKSADRLRNTLRNTFAFAGVGILANQVIQLTDAFTSLQNRIRVVTKTQSELVAVTEELFNVARETRSSFEGTVELYSRLAISSRELGVSMLDLTKFTRAMNQAIILSGASGREANAGLIQLSQGIASGALRGDELRSVLEQLPVVADVIAKQMNVTRGELRALGATGSITATTIIKAFENAREELAERFAKTVPTISQAFQVFRNSLVRNIGAFATSSGAAQALSKSLLLLADNLENVLRLVSALTLALGVNLAQRVLPLLITKINSLTAAIAANPIGAVIVAITTAISLLVTFGDKITVETGKLTTLADVATVSWKRIQDVISSFINFFQNNFGVLGELTLKTFRDIEFSIANVILFVAKAADKFVGVWIAAYHITIEQWRLFGQTMKFIFSEAINAIIATTEKGINKTAELFNKFFETVGLAQKIGEVEISRIGKGLAPNAEASGRALREALKKGLNFSFFSEGVKNILKDAEKLAIERSRRKTPTISDDISGEVRARDEVRRKFNETLQQLDREIELLQLSSSEHKILTEIFKIEKKIKGDLSAEDAKLLANRLVEIETLTRQRNIYENIISPIKEYKDTLEALNALLQQGKISQEEFNAALKATQLGGDLAGVKTDLLGGEIEIRAEQLRNQLNERQLILQQAREAELISEKEFFKLSLEAQKRYNVDSVNNELQRGRLIATSAAQTFGALTNLARIYAGEQSTFYRNLFALTKAFAIADASIQIAGALAKAANTPWPANIAAIAQVASLTAGIVNTIASVQYAGAFRNGGDFVVGGSGAPDSQIVSFRATPGEQVSVRTPAQVRRERTSTDTTPQIMEERGQDPVQPTVIEQTIINTINPDDIIEESTDSVFINKIQNNQDAIRNVLRG